MSALKRFWMQTVLLCLATVAAAWAAEVPRQYVRLDLTDGRILTNVVIKSYDAATGKLLLVADGKAMLVPVSLIPPPFAARLKAGVPAAGSTTSVVAPQTDAMVVSPVKSTATPAAQVEEPASATVSDQQLAGHKKAAQTRARRYYQYEYQAGSNAISITALDIDTEQPEAITGWLGRYRTKGKAYLEFYDSKGGSFNRTTDSFEVITEQKPGKPIEVVDFTRL